MKRIALSIFIFSLFTTVSFSQTKIAYAGDSGYTLVERTNLRRYVNGKYSGLTSREVRSFISRTLAPEGIRSSKFDRWYDGNFFVLEETLRNSQATMAGIHDAIPSVFRISPDGKMTMVIDNGYPTFRSFPSFPSEKVKPGDSWKGEGERAVDPLNKGIFTRIPVLALYTFEGEETYKGENVYRIKAIWQTNYLFSNYLADPRGDESLRKGTGGHKADIIVRASTGEAILISDNVDETFIYSDGTQVNLKGTITLFTEYPPAIDRNKLIYALNRIAKADTSSQGKKTASDKSSDVLPSGISGGASGTGIAGANQSGSGNSESNLPSSISGGSAIASAKYGSGSTIASETAPFGEGSAYSSTSSIASSKPLPTSAGPGIGEKITTSETGIPGTASGAGSGTSLSALSERIASSKGISSSKGNGSGEESSSSTADDKNNMVFEETPAGIRLSVRDIKFRADSSDVLTTEKVRLDEIAEVLKLAPNSHFLIEGHTAAVGKPAGEQTLSEERARKIAAELSKRGISADKFICKGHGGNKPIASNATDAGRAQNRRVEITILE